MKETSDIVAGVVDHGIFLPVAEKLAQQYKHVYYTSPWEEAYPTRKKALIGHGFENMTRVDSIWQVKSKCDIFIFPDIGFEGEQEELKSQGLPVWGGGYGDKLELMRGDFLEWLESVGLDVPKYEKIKGLTKLREHLRDKKDKYIKFSKYRGDMETWHWRDWAHDESTLNYYAYKLGPTQDLATYYVLDSIDTDIEDGMDTYCILGKVPTRCIHGMEAKDKSFLATITNTDDIPEQVLEPTLLMASELANYDYKGALSSEVRIKDDKNHFIDPTLRFGSPPHQLMTEMFENLGEIIAAGAHGECIDPVPPKDVEFGMQAIITIKGDDEAWGEIVIPDELKQWVKASAACILGEKLCSPPDEHKSHDLGWLCAVGKTIEETADTLKEYAGQLPDGLSVDLSSLVDLIKEVESAEEAGMPFTDAEVPAPETMVIDD